MNEVFVYLCKDGTFTRIVVVRLRRIVGSHTLVAILPSGHHYADDRALTLNQLPEMRPFNCVGLMLRESVWQRPRLLTREDLEESAPSWSQQRMS